MIVHKN